jgi:cell division protein FtsZ
MSMVDAFRRADSVLLNAVQGISDLMTVPGLINVDFADVRTIMNGMGRALMGAGVGSGKRRATEAAEMAISSPLLEDVSIQGATGILINITGGPDLTLHEVNEASTLIQNAAHDDANIIFGSVIDPNLTDEVRITVIATGFDRSAKTIEPPVPTPQPVNRGRTSQQVTLPYDNASVTTREYPATLVPPARKTAGEIDPTGASPPPHRHGRQSPTPYDLASSVKAPALLVEDAEVDVSWSDGEMSAVERALSELHVDDSVPEPELSQRMAMGSAPVPGDAVAAPTAGSMARRAPPRPSLKGILGDEVENELDVPTFIRRHTASQG